MPAPWQISDNAVQYSGTSGVSARRLSGWIDYQYTNNVKEYIKANDISAQLFKKSQRALIRQGRGYSFPIYDGTTAGVHYASNVSTPIAPVYRQPDPLYAYVDTKNFYMSISIFGKDLVVMKNSASNPAVWLMGNLDAQIKRLATTAVLDRNIKLFQDGSGVLAQVKTTPMSGYTVAMKHWSGRDIGATTHFVVKGTSVVIIEGNISSPNYGLPKFTSYVTTTSWTNGTMTLADSPVGFCTAGDFVVRGDANGNDYGIAFEGMYKMFDATSTYLGVTTANFPEFYPRKAANPVSAGTARPYNPQLVIDQLMLSRNNGIGDGVDLLVSSTEVWSEHYKNYVNTVTRAVFESDMGVEIDLPLFEFTGQSIPWFTTPLMTPDHIAGLTTDSWELLEDDPGTWDRGENGTILRRIPNTDAWLGFYYRYDNMFNVEPQGNFLITDIAVSGKTIRK